MILAPARVTDRELSIAPIASAPPSPIDVADALIDATLAARADVLWLEPLDHDADRYQVTIERDGQAVARAAIAAGLGTAVIARLALICGLDLVSPRAVTGTTRVAAGGATAELVMTLRPGAAIRAELLVVRRSASRPAPGRTTELHVGDTIGHHRVVGHVGSGGMGTVVKVEHVALGRSFALKVLHAGVLARDPGAAAGFLREARAAARIKHPNIIEVVDYGHLGDGRPYIVMELLTGVRLTDVVAEGALEPRRALSIARQLASALAAAHEHGVIHADVSPANVLVAAGDGEPVVKLVDFGLAQVRDDELARGTSDYVFGTPSYISPEQLRGQGPEEGSDIYSLGAVLFELLAGAPPFEAEDLSTLCSHHLHTPPPEPVSPHGPLPRRLIELVRRCLAKTPAQRPANMPAVIVELDKIDDELARRGWRRWLAP